MRRVFLSSTSKDLARCRQEVYAAIQALDDFACVRMEDFGARPDPPSDYCEAAVAECDVFVILAGGFYGSIDPAGRSFTEAEYEAARLARKDCLVFMSPAGFPAGGGLSESDEKRSLQDAFRQRLRDSHIVKDFSDCTRLATFVVQALNNLRPNQSALRLRRIAPVKDPHPVEYRDPLVSIGRSPANQVVLPEADVSWEQGHIIRMQGAYYYRHLSQTNPTMLRRPGMQKLFRPGEAEELLLHPQDRLTVGSTTFVVEFDLVAQGRGYMTTRKREETG
jgi:hypothetical protein